MDALNKNIPVNQPIYCDTEGEDPVDPLTVMYNWMHVRASGPNCLKDNIFCGDNSFKEDVTIEGNLTVLGTFDPVGEVDIGLDELNDVELTGPLVDGQVLIYDGPSMMWVNGVTAGGGDVTNGNNVPVGPGAEVFRDKTAGVLNFRKLVGVTNTTVTQVGDTIEIGSTGDITGGANLGGGQEVFKNELAGVLNFRTLVAGANMTLTTIGDTVSFAASGGIAATDCIGYVVAVADVPNSRFTTLQAAVTAGRTYIIVCVNTTGATLLDNNYYIVGSSMAVISSPILTSFTRNVIIENLIFSGSLGEIRCTGAGAVYVRNCTFTNSLDYTGLTNNNIQFYECKGSALIGNGVFNGLVIERCEFLTNSTSVVVNALTACRIINNRFLQLNISGTNLDNSIVYNNIFSNGLACTTVSISASTFDNNKSGNNSPISFNCSSIFYSQITNNRMTIAISCVNMNLCEVMYNIVEGNANSFSMTGTFLQKTLIVGNIFAGGLNNITPTNIYDCVIKDNLVNSVTQAGAVTIGNATTLGTSVCNNNLHFSTFAGIFTDCVFSGNSVPAGVIIGNWTFTGTVNDSTFNGNRTKDLTLTVANSCTFTGNRSLNLVKIGGAGNIIVGHKGPQAGWAVAEYTTGAGAPPYAINVV